MAKKDYHFIVEIKPEDYKLLKLYGFAFEKNFSCYIEEVAIEMRYWIKKRRERK